MQRPRGECSVSGRNTVGQDLRVGVLSICSCLTNHPKTYGLEQRLSPCLHVRNLGVAQLGSSPGLEFLTGLPSRSIPGL